MDFYISKEISINYKELLDKINSSLHFYDAYFAHNYFDFITNIILCLCHDVDVTLIDFRNNHPKSDHGRAFTNQCAFNSIEDLIHRLKNSKSSVGVFSSGTEGEPKLIYQSIERLLKSVQIQPMFYQSRWSFTYNPSHSAGFQVFLQVILNEGTLYDFYKCSRDYIINTIEKHSLTNLSATPTFYRLLAPYDFVWTSIESITFNGEKSTKTLIDNMRKCCPNARIRNIYGSTESGPLISSDSDIFVLPERLIGKVKVVEGELMLHSTLVSKSTNTQGWYHSGDLVEVLHEEPLTFRFISRKSRIINVAGQNVNPQEVEEVLLNHPDIIDAQVLPRSNALIGNVITASIITKNKSLTEKEVLTFLSSRLAKYKIPRIIKFVDHISIGRTGKKSIR